MKLEKWQEDALKKINKESKKSKKLLLDRKSCFLLDSLHDSKLFNSKIESINNKVDDLCLKYRMTVDEFDEINNITTDLISLCCEALSKDDSIYIVM